MKRFILVTLILFFTVLGTFGQTPDWNYILGKIDEMSGFKDNDFSAEMTIVFKKPNTDDNIIQARYFRRDSEKKFVIVILKPEIQKGQGYLAIEDDLWFYDPESRKFAFSSLKDTFQNSDAQNSDFSASTLLEDYNVESYTDEQLGNINVYAVVLIAKDKKVPVPKYKLWIRKDNLLVLKQEHYSLSNRLMRTIAIPQYQLVSGKYIPASMVIVDNLKIGERTQITLSLPSVSRLPDTVFSKTYLERINQ